MPELVYLLKLAFQIGKKATVKDGALLKHQWSVSYCNAVIAFQEYQLTKKHDSSIANQLNCHHKQIVADNRHYLKSIIEILGCARGKLALRGHDELSDS